MTMTQQEILNSATPAIELPDELPPIIPNSTLQLDGDISCYYSAWSDMPLGASINQLKQHIETKRLLAGCEIVNVHTTQGGKAGRETIAQVNEYQDDRTKNKDPEISARVKELRQFLQTYETNTVKPCPQFEVEADDSMNIYQRIEIDLGHYSAICTKDKDLNMCPGSHLTYDDMELFIVPDGYGNLTKTVTKKPANTKSGFKNVTKITGIGTSFFWLQLLMGDSADSVPGLPALTGKLLNIYKPTATTKKALLTINNPRSRHQAVMQANKLLLARKSQPLGAVTAYAMLENCRTDQEALKIVKTAYNAYYGNGTTEYTTWRNETIQITPGSMMLEQARLLWMLRTWDDDVLKFLTEVHNNG